MSANHISGIAGQVESIARPIIESLDLTLWDVEYKKEGTLWYLRIFIDKKDGVSLDDCEAVSRALDKPLDNALFLDKSYYLEVSSPGVERTLKRREHFMVSVGSIIRLRLYSPKDGRKAYEGILLDFSEDGLVLEEKGVKITFAENEISLAQTVFEFN